MSYNSKRNSLHIGLLSNTTHARAVVVTWTEGEKERWAPGVKAVGLGDMAALAEELNSDKTPEDCEAFLQLLHQHAGAALFAAAAKAKGGPKPAERNAALARLCERVMDGRFETDALQMMAALDPNNAALAAAVALEGTESKRTTRGAGGVKRGRGRGRGRGGGGVGGGGGKKGKEEEGGAVEKEKGEEEGEEALLLLPPPASKRAKTEGTAAEVFEQGEGQEAVVAEKAAAGSHTDHHSSAAVAAAVAAVDGEEVCMYVDKAEDWVALEEGGQ